MALCTRQSNYPVTFPAEFITFAKAMPKLHLEIETFSLKKSASPRGIKVIASTLKSEDRGFDPDGWKVFGIYSTLQSCR
jgi:hypothetical protein